MRANWIMAALLCLTFVPVASADEVQVPFSSSVLANVSSPDDDYWGTYQNTPPDPFFLGHPSIFSGLDVTIPSFTFTLPPGSVITNAGLGNILVPTQQNPAIGTGHIVTETPFGGEIDQSLPSIPPTFSTTGTSTVDVVEVLPISGQILRSGNEISFNDFVLQFTLYGRIDSPLLSAGSNWAGYLGGSGQVDIPYTVNFDVTYTPAVPEPATIALLGTGLIALAAVYRRRQPQTR